VISKTRLKFLRSLRRKKARVREGLLLVEGFNSLDEALRVPGAVVGILLTQEAAQTPRGRRIAGEAGGLPLTLLDPEEVALLKETENPAGVFALVKDPCRPLKTYPCSTRSTLLLAAAEVCDPGNLGSLIRSAAALGADGIVVFPGSVEPTNPKVVRASAGALFRIPVLAGSEEELAGRGFEIWAADARGTPLGEIASRPKRLVLVVGNEPRGLAAGILERAARVVAVSMQGDLESLNVAVAAGILLHGLVGLPIRSAPAAGLGA